MIKELKYLFYIIVIFFFIFFTARYYFSDENYKKSYRSISLLDEKIIEFVENKNNKKIKKYSFWKLLYNDE